LLINKNVVKSPNSEKLFIFFDIIADMEIMTGETLDEIANALGITTDAVEKRLQTAKIKPVTRKALYPVGTTDRLRDIKMGRPKKPAK
jgi:predicted ArsR family transcriptional regulator